MFIIIYKHSVIDKIPGPVVIGDEIQGHVVWQVDYFYKVAWVTD